MNTKELVDSLFAGYKETPELADFKEELLGNLNAKIDSFIRQGMDSQTAFDKAAGELGDVSAIAEELSQRTRTETFADAYMGVRRYTRPLRVAAYIIFGIVALGGIVIANLVFFAVWGVGLELGLIIVSTLGTLMPFFVAAAAGFTFLGITQETASLYPVSTKRGLWYAFASGLITFGAFLPVIVFFAVNGGNEFFGNTLRGDHWGNYWGNHWGDHWGHHWWGWERNFDSWSVTIVPASATIIPFLLPGIALLAFLILTEKDRRKRWARPLYKTAAEPSPKETAQRQNNFALYTTTLWLTATGLFFLIGFLGSFAYSWVVFLFAAAIKNFLQAKMPQHK